jgi:4-alpha-glucanotransferase
MSRVARAYIDALGTERSAAPETVAKFEAILSAPVRQFAAPTVVVRDDEQVAVDVTLPAESWTEDLGWDLLREDGERVSGAVRLRDAPVVGVEHTPERTFDTRRVALGVSVPLGAHRLSLSVGGFGHASIHLVVVPRRAEPPPGRTWGIALQLYTVRSARNVGIGDFADLRAFCALAGERGASYVGLNPLHAVFRSNPEDASPYAASSRTWLNWLYIAIDELPEAQDRRVRTLLRKAETRKRAEALRRAANVDYSGVAALKDRVLRACFEALDAARGEALDAWSAAQGERLRRFATYEALVARYGRDLDAWPEALRSPESPEVADFAAREEREVRYGMYLQWCAAEQLAAVATDAARRGVRLYRDLAVGVDANSADVWVDGKAYVRGVSVGAPPDVLNTLGQDWGLPPLDPDVLACDGYAELLALLEANCTQAGALRIDHAFSLARLYWIPRGSDPRSGTYVAYPLDDQLGVVALASARTHCVVIGEDLGTVPEGFRERAAEAGILSYRILFFERARDGRFLTPEEYPALALAASGTHDLPTIPAWLEGDDIALRDRFGLLRVPIEQERAARDHDRAMLLDALVAHGDLATDARHDETAVVVAANRYLAASPCAIVMAQLDDIVGERAPVNVPGTSTEYPNWRRKLAVDIDSFASDERFNRLCSALNEIRPRAS